MSDTLHEFSRALADTVEAGGRYTVRVEARRRLPASGVIWSPDGVIVTAHHVVEWDSNITVGLPPDGRPVPARLVGRDPATDLAVLRADASGLEAAPHAGDGDLRVGHLVLSLGRPGRTVQATLGIVSALGQAWRTMGGGEIDRYLQTDTAMYPGFSGGPLVDAAGRMLGINSSALLRGISLTVPVATVGRLVDTLLAHGRVPRGHLGVKVQPVRLPTAVAERIGQETGVLVLSVESQSPADRGGLLLGDTIVALDGQPVRDIDDLMALLGGDRVGASVPVRVLRGGEVRDLTVTIGERG
ncbi:MAG TPA: PDZ domain-containing protein [Chloroflexi bacterium]|jgi:S1-C subfamily serine protease|nr:PDZ domain-containing protein [Chloroflexota bacterium]